MTVFKACMTIVNKRKMILFMYIGVFVFISLNMSIQGDNNKEMKFVSQDVKIAIINKDKDLMGDYISEYADKIGTKVDIIETKTGISDALFTRVAEYVIEIPEGFTKEFENGNIKKIKTYGVANSYSKELVAEKINQFLTDMMNESKEEDIKLAYKNAIKKDAITTNVSFVKDAKTEENPIVYHYNFAAYAVMAVSILGVTSVISVFRKEDIKKRNLIAPISPVKIGMVQMLVCFLLSIIIWGVFAIAGIIMYKDAAIDKTAILMMFNLLIFSFVSMALGFFVSAIVKSANGHSALANVFSLGFSFVGGVFVPPDMLGKTVKIIASFTPTYWYVMVNEKLNEFNKLDISVFKNVFKYAGIEILFGLAFAVIAFALIRKDNTV